MMSRLFVLVCIACCARYSAGQSINLDASIDKAVSGAEQAKCAYATANGLAGVLGSKSGCNQTPPGSVQPPPAPPIPSVSPTAATSPPPAIPVPAPAVTPMPATPGQAPSPDMAPVPGVSPATAPAGQQLLPPALAPNSSPGPAPIISPGPAPLLSPAPAPEPPSCPEANLQFDPNNCGFCNNVCPDPVDDDDVPPFCYEGECNCFPSNAQVQLYGWSKTVDISTLRVGDQLAIPSRNGRILKDTVYAFGHDDPTAVSEFVALKTNTTTIRLTGDHFLPVGSLTHYKRAKDVTVGDTVFTTEGGSMVISIWADIHSGLYNPLTFSGKIIVDGVVASAHSAWFLDHLFDLLGLSRWVPFTYQLLLSPIRLLYTLLGRDLYKKIYVYMDKELGGLANAGLHYGGSIFIGASATLLLAVTSFITKILPQAG